MPTPLKMLYCTRALVKHPIVFSWKMDFQVRTNLLLKAYSYVLVYSKIKYICVYKCCVLLKNSTLN